MSVGWWYARVLGRGGLPARLLAVASDLYPDGSIVELSAEQASASMVHGWYGMIDYVDGEVRAVHLSPAIVGAQLRLWYAEVRESSSRPPAVHLVAFTGHGVVPGQLLDESALTNVQVRSDDQLGAVRWYPATGEIDQVYVAPASRRRRVGTALVHAAGIVSVARGWARVWGDGQRTAMGESFRNASYWRERAAPLTHVAPPMTPGDATSPA